MSQTRFRITVTQDQIFLILKEILAHRVTTPVLLMTMGTISYSIMHAVPLIGDENSYVGVAQSITENIQAKFNDTMRPRDLRNGVIAFGWFMPGTGIILSPMTTIFGTDVPTSYLRTYILGINLLLLWTICEKIRLRISVYAPAIFLLFSMMSPLYIMFLSTMYSDLLSLHFALLFLIWLDGYVSQEQYAPALIAAIMVALIVHMRAMYPPFLAIVAASWIIVCIKKSTLSRKNLAQFFSGITLICLVFLGMLLPWSQQLSARHGPALTITSGVVNQLNMYAPTEYKQNAMDTAKTGNIYVAIHRKISRDASANNRTIQAQGKIEVEEVLGDISFERRVKRLRRNIRAYFFNETAYIKSILNSACKNSDVCFSKKTQTRLNYWASIGWKTSLIIGLLIFIFPYLESREFGESKSGKSYLLPFLLKSIVFLLCLHPLLALVHGRYHIQLVPIIGIAFALIVTGNCRLWRLRSEMRFHDSLLLAGQMLPVVMAGAIIYLML